MATTKKPATSASKIRQSRLTKARVERALRSVGGIRSAAAEKLGVNRSTITRFMQANPDMVAIEAEIVEDMLDLSEAQLMIKIRAGELKAVTYYLDAKGKDRGYGNKRTSITDADGNAMQPVTLVQPRREMDPDEWRKHHAPNASSAPTLQ